MKSQSYMTRALQSRDPRFARILGRLGYDTPAPEPSAEDVLRTLRAEYEKNVGKRPYMGWDAETLREKIAAASDPADEPAREG